MQCFFLRTYCTIVLHITTLMCMQYLFQQAILYQAGIVKPITPSCIKLPYVTYTTYYPSPILPITNDSLFDLLVLTCSDPPIRGQIWKSLLSSQTLLGIAKPGFKTHFFWKDPFEIQHTLDWLLYFPLFLFATALSIIMLFVFFSCMLCYWLHL